METVDINESRQTEILVVAWVMTGLAIFTVGVKLFARAKIVQIVGWDDFFIFLALVCLSPSQELNALELRTDYRQIMSIVASSFVHYGVVLGFGRHTQAVAAEYGQERLFQTARYQMLGYRMYPKSLKLYSMSEN